MPPSLRDLLDGPPQSPGVEQGRLRSSLGWPLCWPPEPELQARLVALLGAAPAPRDLPGPAFLTAEAERGGQGALWLFEGRTPTPLGGVAARAVQAAAALALRALPDAADLDALLSPPEAPKGATLVGRTAGLPPAVVEGDSLGLAALLHAGARALGVDARRDVAIGALDEHGRVLRVGGLGPKLAALRGVAVGLARVWVSVEQAAEVEGALPPGVQLIAVATSEGAMQVLGAMAPHPSRPSGAERDQVGALFGPLMRAAVQVTSWTAVERVARRWAAQVDEPHLGWQLDWIAATAGRHAGHHPERFPSPSPPVGELADPVRALLLSQCIQHVADGGEGDADLLLAELPGDAALRGVEWRQATGAAARLALSLGRLEAAVRWAREATQAWIEAEARSGASFALCAWLIAAGALGEPGAIHSARRVATTLRRSFEPAPQHFVDLAAARALLPIDPARAADALRDLSGRLQAAPDYLHGSCGRAWAAAALAHGDRGEAARLLGELRASAAEPGRSADLAFYRDMAELDRALEGGLPWETALEALRGHPRQLGAVARRMLPPDASAPALTRALKAFPY
jgi:hypothetical protein